MQERCGYNSELMETSESLFEKYICRVRTAHQPLKAPEGIKRLIKERSTERIVKAIEIP